MKNNDFSNSLKRKKGMLGVYLFLGIFKSPWPSIGHHYNDVIA